MHGEVTETSMAQPVCLLMYSSLSYKFSRGEVWLSASEFPSKVPHYHACHKYLETYHNDK